MSLLPTTKPLDVLGIGASKSGTTSLDRYLRQHPQIWLPIQKELPFFLRDDVYARGWPAFAREHFREAPTDRLWGKITPRYLGEPHVPERVVETMPAVKLFAILRNPVDRTFSNYRLRVRSGSYNDSFSEVVERMLDARELEIARTERVHTTRTLLTRGEYGRQVRRWLRYFPRKQLHVLFTEELARDAGATLAALLEYLELEPFEFEDLDQRHNVGADRMRFPGLVSTVRRVPLLRAAWHRLSPERQWVVRGTYRRWSRVAGAPEFPADVRRRLVEFFRPDVALLEEQLGRPVPWADFQTAAA